MTRFVFNTVDMKTIGDRIRQAREFRGLSGEELALRVGYKTQSGISNLENRATGRGGFMLPKIAEALDISVEWFIQGPDTDDLSTVDGFKAGSKPKSFSVNEPPISYHALSTRDKAHQLLDKINDTGLLHVIEMLEAIAARHPINQTDGAGVFVPAQLTKQASAQTSSLENTEK